MQGASYSMEASMVGRRMHLSANGVRLIPFRIIRIPALKHGSHPIRPMYRRKEARP